jgi:hypothetical protein
MLSEAKNCYENLRMTSIQGRLFQWEEKGSNPCPHLHGTNVDGKDTQSSPVASHAYETSDSLKLSPGERIC